MDMANFFEKSADELERLQKFTAEKLAEEKLEEIFQSQELQLNIALFKDIAKISVELEIFETLLVEKRILTKEECEQMHSDADALSKNEVGHQIAELKTEKYSQLLETYKEIKAELN